MASKSYEADGIVVRFDAARCIHEGRCGKGLPAVFNSKERPWVQPGNAPVEDVVRVVETCPSGALTYELTGGPAEPGDGRVSIRVAADGPLYLRGPVTLTAADGTERVVTRVALCRCGLSSNKPFCDKSHRDGFSDSGCFAP